MKSLFIFITSIILSYQSFSQINPDDERAIRNVLAQQEECWNNGDLECFMEGYWKSDQLVFIGKSGVTYGWQKTLDNYKKSYPDKDAMGELSFKLLIVEPLSNDFWTVIGKWSLQRTNDNPNGYFTLLFRRLGDEWVIVSDHTS